jgi:hypothetical protein
MVNLGILKITFNYFLTYKAIQTRPPVLLVDSPYKSCIAPPSDPPPANIYYFIDVSLKKGARGVMFLTFFF